MGKNVRMGKNALLFISLTCVAAVGQLRASVITGTITDWAESSSFMTIGDGINHVQMWWSVSSWDSSGYFYGRSYGVDSDVSAAPGITAIGQITDAASMSYTSLYVGPLFDAGSHLDGVGDFVVYRNDTSGHFGVLRMDDVHSGQLNATWWFQTDGSGNFAPASSVPEPSAMSLALAGLFFLGFARFRARRRAVVK